jgi:copper transport protein
VNVPGCASRGRRVALAVLLALSAHLAGGASAAAHALLVSSTPAANAVLATAPTSVTLTFTEPPDPRLSSVRVLDASGAGHTTGPAVAGVADGGSGTGGPGAGLGATTLTVPLGPLPNGVYTVAWRTVSAADGHATAGSFAFSVGTGAPPPASASVGASSSAVSGASTVSPAAVLARAVLYLGMVMLLGSLVTAEWLVGERRRRVRPVRVAGWVAAVAGGIALVIAQAADAGVGIGDALGSSLGFDALGRLAPLALAGAAMLIGARRVGWRRSANLAAAVLVAGSLLADAVASHASTVVAPSLNIALQWLHAVGVGVWLGGLAGLLLELRDPDRDDRARLALRFSRVATVGILTVALTGVARAAFELHDLGELLSTDYGRLLLVKLALFTGLAGLGAVNHFRNVPAGERRLGSIRRLGSLELLLGATAITVASLLVTTAPPADTGAASAATTGAAPATAPSAITVDGADYATTVRLRLEITPAPPGPTTFRATATDYDTGAAVPVTSLRLRFALPARPDVGASTLALAAGADGAFTGAGSNLSLAGAWTVTALVAEASSSVEVPLTVIAAPPSAGVDVNRVSGQPTLYSVHLAGGSQAQLYLDPLAPGSAVMHITYFDATGRELPVTNVSVTAAQGDGPSRTLTVSPIEPGHVTAHVDTTASAPIGVAVAGSGPSGSMIAFSLAMTPDP